MSMQPLFIVADDHALIRTGMKLMLPLLVKECAVCDVGSAEELFATLDDVGEAFTLLFLDLGLPGCKGTAALERTREKIPGNKICIVSGETNPAVISMCLDFDVLGFIPKSLGDEEFVSALQQLLSGNPCYPRIHDFLQQQNIDRRLSKKQTSILQLLSIGASHEDIARETGISVHGVHYHVREIFRKMNVSNRVQAVHAAREKSLIE